MTARRESTQHFVNRMVAMVAVQLQRQLLKIIHDERVRHWEMRGHHRLGKHFERGFFRGLKHADEIVRSVLNPKRIRVSTRKPKARRTS